MTQPIPATKLLASHYRSGRGACGFVLVIDPELTLILAFRGYFPLGGKPPETSRQFLIAAI